MFFSDFKDFYSNGDSDDFFHLDTETKDHKLPLFWHNDVHPCIYLSIYLSIYPDLCVGLCVWMGGQRRGLYATSLSRVIESNRTPLPILARRPHNELCPREPARPEERTNDVGSLE